MCSHSSGFSNFAFAKLAQRWRPSWSENSFLPVNQGNDQQVFRQTWRSLCFFWKFDRKPSKPLGDGFYYQTWVFLVIVPINHLKKMFWFTLRKWMFNSHVDALSKMHALLFLYAFKCVGALWIPILLFQINCGNGLADGSLDMEHQKNGFRNMI